MFYVLLCLSFYMLHLLRRLTPKNTFSTSLYLWALFKEHAYMFHVKHTIVLNLGVIHSVYMFHVKHAIVLSLVVIH